MLRFIFLMVSIIVFLTSFAQNRTRVTDVEITGNQADSLKQINFAYYTKEKVPVEFNNKNFFYL